MPQPERLLLVHVAHVIVANALHLVGVSILAARAQRGDQVGIGREVVLNRLLGAAVHDDDLVGLRRQALLHHILDDGAVDHEQHLFRLRLRGGKEARAQTGSGN